jgi:hypothetical protein
VTFESPRTAKTSTVSVDRGDGVSADESRKREGLGVTCGVKAPGCATARFEVDGVKTRGRSECLKRDAFAESVEGDWAEWSSHGSFLCTLVTGVAMPSILTTLRGVCGASSSLASSWSDKDQGNESWSTSTLSSRPASVNGRFRVLLGWLSVDVLFGDDCIF